VAALDGYQPISRNWTTRTRQGFARPPALAHYGLVTVGSPGESGVRLWPAPAAGPPPCGGFASGAASNPRGAIGRTGRSGCARGAGRHAGGGRVSDCTGGGLQAVDGFHLMADDQLDGGETGGDLPQVAAVQGDQGAVGQVHPLDVGGQVAVLGAA